MLIWSLFFAIALICVIVLIFYLNVELNELDKKITELSKDIESYYED